MIPFRTEYFNICIFSLFSIYSIMNSIPRDTGRDVRYFPSLCTVSFHTVLSTSHFQHQALSSHLFFSTLTISISTTTELVQHQSSSDTAKSRILEILATFQASGLCTTLFHTLSQSTFNTRTFFNSTVHS